MTQPQALNVEKEELLARANELVAPIAGLPVDNPQAPCGLASTVAAAKQLALSADNMRLYLSVGERERQRLADSLRNAAKAYEESDESAEQAIASETSVRAVALGHANGDANSAMLRGTPAVASGADEFQDLLDRALQLEQQDQGAAFTRFADAWEKYQGALQEACHRFRPFQHWSGLANEAVESNFDAQRAWLDSMSSLCGQMASQARTVVTAQKWIRNEHIWYTDIKRSYNDILTMENVMLSSPNKMTRQQGQLALADMQKKSDGICAEYANKANLPLSPINPPRPPTAYPIDPPEPKPKPKPDVNPDRKTDVDSDPDPTPNPTPDIPDPIIPDTPDPGGDSGFPSTPAIPTTPPLGTPTMPPASDPAATGPLSGPLSGKSAPSLPGGAGGVKPASFGGAGAPNMPLQRALDADLAARPAGTAPGEASLGRGLAGAAGAMGGGAPVGGGQGAGQGQGAGKGKRVPGADEESLYTEDRAWTEGVIGFAPKKRGRSDGQKSD